MTWLILLAGGIFVILMISGFGKNRILRTRRDIRFGKLELIMNTSGRIIDNSVPGSKTWNEAGKKHSAAFREFEKRHGRDPISPVLLQPKSTPNWVKPPDNS